MPNSSDHQLWLDNPTGKIAKGEFCRSCARFNARPMATNVILLKDSQILLVQRGDEPDKGWWDLPGGYLDWDETVEQGAARELKEETGLVVDPASLKLFHVFSTPQNKAKNQVVDLYFTANQFSGELTIDGTETVAVKWFSLDSLPEKVAFDHLPILQRLPLK